MTTTTARDLFVFAGAGVSVPPPSNLRQFTQIRDEALTQLGLDGLQDLAADIIPEPFLQALFGQVDVVTWLRELLGSGSPNAVHYALAALSRSGAAVWTVKFRRTHRARRRVRRRGLEAARHAVRPDGVHLRRGPPRPVARVGSVTASECGWPHRGIHRLQRQRPRLRPVWDDVLRAADHVVWYVFGTDDASTRASAERYLRGLLPSATAEGKLTIEVSPNPGRHLIDWLVRQGIVSDTNSWPIDELGDRPRPSLASALRGDLDAAAAEVLSTVGAVKEAKARYFRRIRDSRDVRRSIGHYLALTINHGGSAVARALWVGNLMPPVGRLAGRRDRYLRKRVTIHSNLGHHRTVLRLTRRIPSYATATRAVVRLGSLKYFGDLRGTIDLGKTATIRAARQPHAILAANAAYQTTQEPCCGAARSPKPVVT